MECLREAHAVEFLILNSGVNGNSGLSMRAIAICQWTCPANDNESTEYGSIQRHCHLASAPDYQRVGLIYLDRRLNWRDYPEGQVHLVDLFHFATRLEVVRNADSQISQLPEVHPVEGLGQPSSFYSKGKLTAMRSQLVGVIR